MNKKPEFPIVCYCDDNDLESRYELIESDFTCSQCKEVNTCDYAWDLYNIGNDCIANK